MYKHKLMY